jgi:hypothetical protein
MIYRWCSWPGMGVCITLTSPINLMAFGGPLFTLWGWWGLKMFQVRWRQGSRGGGWKKPVQ